MMKHMRYILLVLVACVVLLPGKVSAGVNDFTISDFTAEYYLSKDDDGRSRLKVVEKITAQFPSIDQNHGIERAIPHAYDGHTTHLQIDAVQKNDGTNWNYTTRGDGDATVLRIGDADRYVHGQQGYVISYSLRDVTKYFSDSNDDELYWDTNGTGWLQPFSNLSATVYIDKSLASDLTGNYSCAQGAQGSKERCTIMAGEDVATGTKLFSVASTRPLSAGENVSFAIGFKPQTFAMFKTTTSEKILAFIVFMFMLSLFVGGAVGIALIIWFVVRYYRNQYRKGDMGPIAPEYLPPKGTSVLAAAKVLNDEKGNPQSAQIIDLAVRHYIKIYQTSGKSFFKSAEYEIELVKPVADLLPEEQQFISTLFGGKSRLPLKELKNNAAVFRAFQSIDKQLTKSLQDPAYAIYEKDLEESSWFKRASIITLIIGLVTISPVLLIAAAVAYGMSRSTVQVSEKGLALERYLYGLRDYIK
ncbi:DUF2207 domain-containing protein, partial [Candidatus Saccharibacteria bacterium]|nr:DUF2207 domain-containing protein [Candidatus Saccharibacteria bacterium]